MPSSFFIFSSSAALFLLYLSISALSAMSSFSFKVLFLLKSSITSFNWPSLSLILSLRSLIKFWLFALSLSWSWTIFLSYLLSSWRFWSFLKAFSSLAKVFLLSSSKSSLSFLMTSSYFFPLSASFLAISSTFLFSSSKALIFLLRLSWAAAVFLLSFSI